MIGARLGMRGMGGGPAIKQYQPAHGCEVECGGGI